MCFNVNININEKREGASCLTFNEMNSMFISKSSLKAFMRHCIRTKIDTWATSVLINGFNAPLCLSKLATWKISHLHIIVLNKRFNFNHSHIVLLTVTKWHIQNNSHSKHFYILKYAFLAVCYSHIRKIKTLTCLLIIFWSKKMQEWG